MSRVLTTLLLCIAIFACPFICRASGSCCGGTDRVSVATDCCCSCPTDDVDNNQPVEVPEPSDKQCLCSGAVVADAGVQIVAPEVGLLDLPAPHLLTGTGDWADRVDNLRRNSCRDVCCLNVRLLV